MIIELLKPLWMLLLTSVGVVLCGIGSALADEDGNNTRLAEPLQWARVADLPATPGLGGPIAGVHAGTVIVAGGANFPDGRPWDGAAKVWHDRVYLLPEGETKWHEVEKGLPQPLGYAVSVRGRSRSRLSS